MSDLMNLTKGLATNLGIQSSSKGLLETLKATAFKGQVDDNQMSALLIVAAQHNLNPWTKEIYAFPDRNNGIVPVVGVDGWSRIINSHPQFDGMEFKQDKDSCTCRIYRKDRSHPITVTEWLDECNRGTQPWKSHPKRMLRHKALIQCARLAFSYTGIYDEDEAVVIAHGAETTIESSAVEMAGSSQVAEVSALIEATSSDEEKLMSVIGAASIESMTIDQSKKACSLLRAKQSKQNAQEVPHGTED